MSIYRVSTLWDRAQEAGGNGRVDAQSLFEACVQVCELTGSVVVDFVFAVEAGSDFLAELLVLVGIPDQSCKQAG